MFRVVEQYINSCDDKFFIESLEKYHFLTSNYVFGVLNDSWRLTLTKVVSKTDGLWRALHRGSVFKDAHRIPKNTHTGPGGIRSKHASGLGGTPAVPAFRRQRPEDCEFEANLGYVERFPSRKTKQRNKKQRLKHVIYKGFINSADFCRDQSSKHQSLWTRI